jgi:UDP-N-acetylmuramate dehydrogenase
VTTIERNVPLARLTTFKVGGAADHFCAVRSEEDIREALDFARREGLKTHILGGGSNVLVSDEGIAGLVVKVELRGIEAHEEEDGRVRIAVAAGESWDEFVAMTVASGWWGLENLSGIPGTVGAAPIQNIGAYGTEVGELIERVEAIDMRDGRARTFTRVECAFGYRESWFKTEEGKHMLITRVHLVLSRVPAPRLAYRDVAEYFRGTEAPSLLDIRSAVLAIRGRKFPDLAHYGTAGSFFKNPIIPRAGYDRLAQAFSGIPSYPAPSEMVKIPAGWLIEHVGGFRGSRQGRVGSFENQALVVVNYGGATAKDILGFAENIQQTIYQKTGITLQFEVQVLR